ncbi:acyl-CoA thioesterase [Leucobacter tardus]|uniref:Acyl-CoA thioesterase n=1 Tax=Leucobacter tardus TaxID=501483 RepID=A0A939QKZ1_9MICO|nr:thioesterase family protein [Leucobacter tardus]MBO2989796.1 acyl-CoA thioesterase [Leucobacter tardus]
MARWSVSMELRWGDQDAYGHVNNVAFARYLEEARVRTFWPGAGGERNGMEGHFRGDIPGGPKMLVANQQIEFVRVLEYADAPIAVEIWIGKLGGSSLELHYEISAGGEGSDVVARAITTIVIVDGESLRPQRLSDAARASIEPWCDAPVSMRRG